MRNYIPTNLLLCQPTKPPRRKRHHHNISSITFASWLWKPEKKTFCIKMSLPHNKANEIFHTLKIATETFSSLWKSLLFFSLSFHLCFFFFGFQIAVPYSQVTRVSSRISISSIEATSRIKKIIKRYGRKQMHPFPPLLASAKSQLLRRCRS